MKKQVLGNVLIVCSIILFSLEIYGLKIIQILEKISGQYYENPFNYVFEPVVLTAFLINLIVLIVGIICKLNSSSK